MILSDKIIEIIKRSTDNNYDISTETEFSRDLKIDSFEWLMIINDMEDEFSIEVDERDIKSFNTVNDIVDALENKYL